MCARKSTTAASTTRSSSSTPTTRLHTTNTAPLSTITPLYPVYTTLSNTRGTPSHTTATTPSHAIIPHYPDNTSNTVHQKPPSPHHTILHHLQSLLLTIHILHYIAPLDIEHHHLHHNEPNYTTLNYQSRQIHHTTPYQSFY